MALGTALGSGYTQIAAAADHSLRIAPGSNSPPERWPRPLVTAAASRARYPEVAHFIGQSLVARSAPIVPNLVRAVVVYAVAFAMVYIIAGVIDLLAPRFGVEKNFPNAVKLSAYSHTPLWLAGIFLLIPGLNFLLILGLYGFYLLWVGLPMLMKVPNDKALPYAAIVTACALIPAIVLTMI